ncbi:HD domain-containing phosphohydrolase [Bosea sp. (in: a-proteobacteria)]|uniref:HD-GYP domain-containing protein n=1 Tax=Bosea sp. (in: a-proteobacteria) TaxID=1871050 RepID=UPI001209FDC3|nr:HD domain-containing phosphohydrolase [Bosea sp. (in: a-proteobacteria)]TAJ27256.1 MAG: HD domain-containing protein [Bosea sp. (in: a-proteobacteria)]
MSDFGFTLRQWPGDTVGASCRSSCPIVVLVSDRHQHRQSLQRALSIWGACDAFDPADVDGIGRASDQVFVVDLDLTNRDTIAAARFALAPHRRSGAPCLFLLRDMSPRAQIQANALGAKLLLPVDTPHPVLLDRVGMLLGRIDPGSPAAAVQQRFIAASAGTADLLDAAGAGRALPVAAIGQSIEALNRAADGGNLGAWLDLVWQHDDATYQHCLLVSGLAAAFAQRLGFSEADRAQVAGAALLHDIGKARVPLDILRKEGPLDPGQQAVMRRHPEIGYELLVAQGGFTPLTLAAVLSHHELLDGSGYPHGIGGDQLPDLVRMITICDIYGALIERRPYKPAMAPEDAFGILVGMGAKLDMDLVRAFGGVVLGAATAGLGTLSGPRARKPVRAA